MFHRIDKHKCSTEPVHFVLRSACAIDEKMPLMYLFAFYSATPKARARVSLERKNSDLETFLDARVRYVFYFATRTP